MIRQPDEEWTRVNMTHNGISYNGDSARRSFSGGHDFGGDVGFRHWLAGLNESAEQELTLDERFCGLLRSPSRSPSG